MRILILGGTGIISRYVVLKYRNEGHQIIVLNRGNKRKLNISGVNYKYVDTNNREALSEVTEDIFFDKILDFTTYHHEVMKMKTEILQKRCHHYIFISSVAVYERRENCKCYTEEMTLGNSRWIYGYDKSCCEKALREMYDGEKSCHYTIIRPGITYSDAFIPYSPIDTYNMPGYLIYCILNGKEILTTNQGEDKMQVLHSYDFAENLYGLLNLKECYGEAINISGDEYVTSNQIIRKLTGILGMEARVCYLPQHELGELAILPKGGWHDTYSNEKAKTILENYRAGETIYEHLRETLCFYERNPEWMLWPESVENQIQRVITDAKRNRKLIEKQIGK